MTIMEYWQIILVGILLLVLVGYLLLKLWPKSGKIGINTKTVTCPRCGLKAPIVRRPTNIKQALWGGWTCAQCKCEFDKYSNKVNT